jgi:3-oxoacyl-[acyl-carrier-protein] synthase-1
MKTIANIILTPKEIHINGSSATQGTEANRPMSTEANRTQNMGSHLSLNTLYRNHVNNYPKFFKMDGLCKLGFLASELLIASTDEKRFVERDDRAVILFGRKGSSHADHRFQATIDDPEDYYPSPALFVYTLPNIVTGEIAIRNKYLGETSFFLLENYDEAAMKDVVEEAFMDEETKSVLAGWVDFTSEVDYLAKMWIINRE